MKVLLIAPFYDQTVAGESWSTFKWIQGISQRHETTILTTHRHTWDPEKSQVDAARIINWKDPELPSALARLNRELKPTYVLFYLRARRWIKKALRNGERFDLVHQINPLALRYPCPARGLGLKYMMGPLAGSLNTPAGFSSESSDRQWYRKLRNLDHLRISHDPWLKGSYSEAAAIVGVAPYVNEILQPASIARFETASETGVESVAEIVKQPVATETPLRLLYVGRIIRTKGVIDAIRAVANASKSCSLQFDILGEGDMLDACKKEADALGVNHIVTFHGRIPREEVDEWYRKAHVFLFPSFREPSGNVVFEALGHGLPIITSDRGGPGYVVDSSCGILVPAIDPQQYARDLTQAILDLRARSHELPTLSRNGLERISKLALWDNKHAQMENIYQSLVKSAVPQAVI